MLPYVCGNLWWECVFKEAWQDEGILLPFKNWLGCLFSLSYMITLIWCNQDRMAMTRRLLASTCRHVAAPCNGSWFLLWIFSETLLNKRYTLEDLLACKWQNWREYEGLKTWVLGNSGASWGPIYTLISATPNVVFWTALRICLNGRHLHPVHGFHSNGT